MRTSGLQRIHPRVAQIHKRRCGLDRTVLHQDRGLLELFAQGVSVIRMAMEGPRTHDQVALERAGDAHLDAELIRRSRLTLADALHLRGMPSVELGAALWRLALAALRCDALGLLQRLAQDVAHGLREQAGLALDFAPQAPHDRALAPDRAAHASPLPGVGIASGLAGEVRALFGKGLLEFDPRSLVRCHPLAAGHLQQTAVGGVRYGLPLHRAVDDHATEFLRLNELELGSDVDGLRQQLLHPFFAQQLAELDQRGGVARQPILVISAA